MPSWIIDGKKQEFPDGVQLKKCNTCYCIIVVKAGDKAWADYVKALQKCKDHESLTGKALVDAIHDKEASINNMYHIAESFTKAEHSQANARIKEMALLCKTSYNASKPNKIKKIR
tara:strand:- start:86 stop:433 length:348 start_codon:yes stop_codon:yes gene_type:complete